MKKGLKKIGSTKKIRCASFLILLWMFGWIGGPVSASDVMGLVSGRVISSVTGEPLPWASVYVMELATGVNTNVQGEYAIRLKSGQYTIKVTYVGYQEMTLVVTVDGRLVRDFALEPAVTRLQAMVITDRKASDHVTETSMSMVRMNTEMVKKIPALMGETDILKTLQLMPGVQQAAEGFSGFSVRGGSTDQNLMLLDGATVFNASHLMGFFSVFNSDAVSDMTLYKGDIPARHGGRLASLVEVQMREGNTQQIRGQGGLGSISSRLTLEGPISKGRSSWLISGRRTYADLFLKLSKDSLLNKNRLFFHDLNGKATFIINKKNHLTVSGYTGMDLFAFREMMEMQWANQTTSIRWNHSFNPMWSAQFSATTSRYDYRLNNSMGMTQFIWDAGMFDHGLKADFLYQKAEKKPVRIGAQVIHHHFRPGLIKSMDEEVLSELQASKSIEYALYGSSEFVLGKRLTMQAGLRLSGLMNVGETKVFCFDEQYKVTDTLHYGKGEIYHHTMGLEPRISAVYLLSDNASVKGGYARTRQYVQPATNSTSGMPYDIWFPVSPNVKPQVSDMISVGYFRNLLNNTLEFSAEMYARKMDHQIDFRHNADLFFNELIEGEIRTGVAEAFGAELLIRKQQGALTGWIGYTASRVRRKIEEVNENRWYNANYDKPHNFTAVVNYELNKRISAGATFVYTTGAPVTLPTGRWEHAGMIMPSYSERNGYRLPNYHRLDLSTTITLNKPESKLKNDLNISVYNVYNRKNPFTIFFTPEEQGSNTMKAYALSMFGIVPSITWNFRF